MELSLFLQFLEEQFVPDLDRLAPSLPGWLLRLRQTLERARQLPLDSPASERTAILGELQALFQRRPEDVQCYLTAFRAWSAEAQARAPRSLADVKAKSLEGVPANDPAPAVAARIVDKIDASLAVATAKPQPAAATGPKP